MNELNVEEIKTLELDVLSVVHNYCVTHNLTYFLFAGTLIGAVRHNGFIPWDDDIDIAMPRKDYELLISDFCEDGYAVCSCGRESWYQLPFAKVYNCNTVKEEYINYKDCKRYGVDIDIFPIDNVKSKSYVDSFNSTRNRIILNMRLGMYKFHRVLSLKDVLINAGILWGHIIRKYDVNRLANKLNEMAEMSSNGETDLSMVYVDPADTKPYYMDKDWFKDTIPHMFEGKMFNIPVGYHQMLTAYYGDYMKLPPEKERVCHHMFRAYFRNNCNSKDHINE